jgi:AcrR family transcriptional regulator
MNDFIRARSEEQREARRQAILTTAEAMLVELGVADVTLNELARRVGLAKSNVLRYFDSREAILMAVLEEHRAAWLDEVAALLLESQSTSQAPVSQCRLAAGHVARSLSHRRVLCDLLSAQAGVLERNVSGEVAARYKRAAAFDVTRLAELLRVGVGGLELADALDVSVGATVLAGALWAYAQTTEAMELSYKSDPALRALRLNYAATLERQVELLLLGAIS